MALSDIIEPFTWGAGGSKLTPEEIARQRAIADALTQQGIDFSPIASPWQGAARLADALVGNIKDARAARAEKANGDYNRDILSRVLGGGSDVFPAAPGMSGTDGSASQPTASPVAATDVPTQRVASAFAASEPSAGTTDWLDYANKNAIRNQPLDPKLTSALSFLPDMGVTMKVFSGGQDATGPNRTGSHRHDHGDAADVFFYKDGRQLDWNNPQDVPIYQQIVERARANGVTGFGAGEGYMRPGSMHIGFGTPAVWGAGGRGTNAPDWLRQAFNTPYEAPPAVAATNAMAGNAPSVPPLPDAVNVPDMPVAGQPVQVAQAANTGTPGQMSDATALSLLGASAYKPGDINPAIVQALSDPRASDMTKQIATMLVKQKLDPNAALETEYKRAQIDALQAQAEKNRNPLALNKFGLQPQYGVDAEGNPVILQLGSNGQAVETQLPNGVKLSKAPIKLDAGDHFVLLDPITRQPVGTIQKNLAEAEAQKAAGKAEGGARFDLPRVEQNADLILGVLDRMKTHPGREGSTGFIQGALPSRTSDQVDFQSLVDQTQGQAFLQAFQMLKGGGQITEIEGQKATNAISRLGNERLSDKDYLQAINDREEVVKNGLARAKVQAGQGGASPSPAAPSSGVVDYRDYFGSK